MANKLNKAPAFPLLETPIGTAHFPHFNTKDTVGDYARGDFHGGILLEKGDPAAEAFYAAVVAAHVRTQQGKPCPAKDGDVYKPQYCAGHYLVSAHTQFDVPIYDAAGVRDDTLKVRHGDRIKLQVQPKLYPAQPPFEGATLYLVGVQLVQSVGAAQGFAPIAGAQATETPGFASVAGGPSAERIQSGLDRIGAEVAQGLKDGSAAHQSAAEEVQKAIRRRAMAAA